jgi:beta-N-acetylhexosaminidase
VTAHVLAFVDGMTSAQVASAVKHFPGLGYVRANTDTADRVVDTRVGVASEGLEPFRAAVRAGVPFVMVSTATYALIDPDRPAAFSAAVVTRLLREDLGFSGVVISDDLGAARQVQAWAPGDRAVRFVAAGGDVVLTVDPRTVAPMYDAVFARARTDAAFRAKTRAAALRVLTAKARFGLLHD